MNKLNRVYDSTLLTSSATYQIDGCLYQYLGKDPYGSIKSPKFRFKPLAGQRKHCELVLNYKQLILRAYEVEGMKVNCNASATDSSVQLSLF